MLHRVLMLIVIAAASSWLCASAGAADPKVPPGQDPGGIAIALIGAGVDYTSPKIALRLARDGEGELIGWDVIDNDRAPYPAPAPISGRGGSAGIAEKSGSTSTSALSSQSAQPSEDDTETAVLMLEAYANGRLVPIRTQPGDAQALAKAIAFATGTPARIVVILQPLDNVPLRLVMRQASERFKDHLFIVAGYGSGADAPTPASGGEPLPSLMNLANVLVVGSLDDVKGKSLDEVIKESDLVVMPRGGSMFAGTVEGAPPRNGREAAALAGASAACQGHGRAEPLKGSALKATMLDVGRTLPDMPGLRVLDPMCWYGGVRN